MKVLAITNLFGYPWDRTRGQFNQQQFDRLAQHVELKVLVAVPWNEALRRPRAYWSARREGRQRWPYVDYFIFWFPPRFARGLHALCFLLSLLLQCPALLLFGRWQALIGSWAYPDAVATTVLGALSATPVLMKVHGSDVNDYLDEPGKRWQILAAARRCRRVMTASAALRERLLAAGLAGEQVQVNYNGVDASMFKPADRLAARQALGQDLTPESRILLFIGNLKLAKGCVDLLRAFVELAAREPSLLLVYLGSGEAQAQLEAEAARAGLSARVRLLGKREHAELPRWLNAADLLCLPSHMEGVPNVVLEAMACGVPVVATRVGGIPEVLPAFAGELVPPRDPAALVAALACALQAPWDRERIAAHARQFDWQTNIERLLQQLRQMEAR